MYELTDWIYGFANTQSIFANSSIRQFVNSSISSVRPHSCRRPFCAGAGGAFHPAARDAARVLDGPHLERDLIAAHLSVCNRAAAASLQGSGEHLKGLG